ncbi:MAG: HPP family protein [Rhizobiales bacterium]|nr:HPP family protein [Hyphomicrobiales bacterium]
MRKEITPAHIVAGAAGGAVAIELMHVLSEHASFPAVLVPFATSIVLVMGTPNAEPAQPRALVGGHLISTVVGLLTLSITGPSPWAAAFTVGVAMAVMHATRTFHPPAGIDPLIVVSHDMSWSFLVAPVAVGALLLAAYAWLWHNLVRREEWPARWW